MSDIWESFPCTIGDHQAFIGFNQTFAELAKEDFPFKNFASFRVTFKSSTEAGFPAGIEFDALNALEDQLCLGIQPSSGVQVGRITYAGHRDFAFYTDMTEDRCFSLIDSIHNKEQHEISLVHKQDQDFQHYWQSIYPTLEDWQVIKDMRVEQVLQDRGDPLTKEREITHWAMFPTVESRAAFIENIPDPVSLQELYESNDQSDNRFVARLTHIGRPDYRSLNRITVSMARIANNLGGVYDGWETELCSAA